MKTILFTGHSLGGGLAACAASQNLIGKDRFSAEAHSIDSVIQALGRRPQQKRPTEK